MSTANFRTMKEFPLYVLPDAVSLVCPVCGEPWEDETNDECPVCGCQEGPEAVRDEWEDEYITSQLTAAMDDLNSELTFFRVSLESGYYEGVQFYVDEPESPPQELDNEDCRYNWDLCRSVAIRKRKAERRKVIRWMDRTAGEWGMEQLVCTARFSNGEAMYERADTVNARVRAACSGIEQCIEHAPAPYRIPA